MQLCKKLEVGILLLALFYLFSPLASVSKTCFFQGVKAGDMIFIFVFCLLFVWLWRFIEKESLGFGRYEASGGFNRLFIMQENKSKISGITFHIRES